MKVHCLTFGSWGFLLCTTSHLIYSHEDPLWKGARSQCVYLTKSANDLAALELVFIDTVTVSPNSPSMRKLHCGFLLPHLSTETTFSHRSRLDTSTSTVPAMEANVPSSLGQLVSGTLVCSQWPSLYMLIFSLVRSTKPLSLCKFHQLIIFTQIQILKWQWLSLSFM